MKTNSHQSLCTFNILKHPAYTPTVCLTDPYPVMFSLRYPIASLLFVIAASGCYDSPKAFPYVLEEERIFGENIMALDIDGDGDDEYLFIQKNEAGENRDAITVNDLAHFSIDQVNLNGSISSGITPIDVDGNGTEELLYPLVRNDSIFVEVAAFDPVTNTGSIQSTHFLFPKPASVDPSIDFDVSVKPVFKDRFAPGAEEEMLFVLVSGYAKTPRGLLVTSFPDFVFRDSIHIGSLPRLNDSLTDYNQDGNLEHVMGTFATGNGASANGMDDYHAYVINFDLADMRIRWKKEVSDKRGETARVIEGDFLTDSGPEVAYFVYNKRKDPAIHIIDPESGEIKAEYHHSAPIQQLHRIKDRDSNQDGFLFTDEQGRLFRSSSGLEDVRQLEFNFFDPSTKYPVKVDNFAGGSDNWFFVASDIHTWLMDENLNPVAMLPYRVHYPLSTSLNVGSVGSKLVVLLRNGDSVFYRLKKNPFFFLYRYWPFLTGFLLLMGMTLPTWITRRSITNLRSKVASLNKEKRTLKSEVDGLIQALAEEKENSDQAAATSSERGKHAEQLQQQITDFLLLKTSDPLFVQLQTVLQKHALDPSFDAAMFASRLGYSKRHLIRIVSDATGYKPLELIWNYRVAFAKKMLAEGGHSMTDVAHASGFNSLSHFSTKFSELEGCTPSEYKSKN